MNSTNGKYGRLKKWYAAAWNVLCCEIKPTYKQVPIPVDRSHFFIRDKKKKQNDRHMQTNKQKSMKNICSATQCILFIEIAAQQKRVPRWRCAETECQWLTADWFTCGASTTHTHTHSWMRKWLRTIRIFSCEWMRNKLADVRFHWFCQASLISNVQQRWSYIGLE